MVVLDLFSGAGGLSEGFFREGATFVGHVEADAHACKTLKTRTAYWNLKKNNQLNIYYDYLLKKITTDELWSKANISDSQDVINIPISDDSFNNICQLITSNMKDKNVTNVDLIIGGPPCQAYSIAGRARLKDSITCDPRNYLYLHYVKFLKKFKPKMFVFENVPGLKSAANGKHFEDIKNAIREAGYHIEYKELIASDYGVLQSRKRIIIIGWKLNDKKELYKYPEFEKIENKFLVNDVLSDLPSIATGSIIEGEGMYIKPSNQYLINSHIRENDFNILTQHETRMHNTTDIEIYKEAISLWNTDGKKLCYKQLSKSRPELIKHKNTTTFTNRFNVVKGNEKASHTVLAHLAMDGHYYIHPDIKQHRSISVREAARLQSFPDDFYFEGSRSAQFRQIGNAVPPKMAQQIAKSIKKILSGGE